MKCDFGLAWGKINLWKGQKLMCVWLHPHEFRQLRDLPPCCCFYWLAHMLRTGALYFNPDNANQGGRKQGWWVCIEKAVVIKDVLCEHEQGRKSRIGGFKYLYISMVKVLDKRWCAIWKTRDWQWQHSKPGGSFFTHGSKPCEDSSCEMPDLTVMIDA